MLGSVPHPCARRCCLPAEGLCLTCAWPSVLALQHWGQCHPHTRTGPNSQAVLCHASPVCPFPCSAPQESRVHLCCKQQLFARQSHRHMEESLGWGRRCSALCCRFLHPFIPVAHHPAASFPGLAASCECSESVLAESFIHQCFSGAALVT